jgi:hypothetical protein
MLSQTLPPPMTSLMLAHCISLRDRSNSEFEHPGPECLGRVVLSDAANRTKTSIVLSARERPFTLKLTAFSFQIPQSAAVYYTIPGILAEWCRLPSCNREHQHPLRRSLHFEPNAVPPSLFPRPVLSGSASTSPLSD